MSFRIKQQRFIEEYCVDFNATQAAIRAGYSINSAGVIGHENLKKPEIKQAIEERIRGLCLSADETTKLISDIARSNLNDYFITRYQRVRPEVQKTLKEVIQDLKNKIEDNEKFFSRSGPKTDEQTESYHEAQNQIKAEILRLEIEMERNPNAKMIVPGPEELLPVTELDITRLVADKKAGRIKSFKKTDSGGISVELYPADAAQDKLARMHGLYKDKFEIEAGDELKNLFKKVMQQ